MSLLVVLLHVAAYGSHAYGTPRIPLFYDSMGRVAVPIIVLASICVFLAIYTLPFSRPSERAQSILSRWNGLTLGAFLVHPLLLDMLINGRIKSGGTTVVLPWNFIHPLFAIPLLTLLYYALSAGIIWLCQKSANFLQLKRPL